MRLTEEQEAEKRKWATCPRCRREGRVPQSMTDVESDAYLRSQCPEWDS